MLKLQDKLGLAGKATELLIQWNWNCLQLFWHCLTHQIWPLLFEIQNYISVMPKLSRPRPPVSHSWTRKLQNLSFLLKRRTFPPWKAIFWIFNIYACGILNSSPSSSENHKTAQVVKGHLISTLVQGQTLGIRKECTSLIKTRMVYHSSHVQGKKKLSFLKISHDNPKIEPILLWPWLQ